LSYPEAGARAEVDGNSGGVSSDSKPLPASQKRNTRKLNASGVPHRRDLHQRGDGLTWWQQLGSSNFISSMTELRLTYATAYVILTSMTERYVKLFKNGRNQAVRIPREFELPGEDAIIRKDGQRLIIEAVPPRSLLAVLATLPTLDEDFPPIEDLPAEPVDF